MDRLTSILSPFTNNMLFSHPLRTSLGAVLGGVIYALLDLFTPFLITKFSGYIDFARLNPWYCVLFGIFILHTQTIFKLLFNANKTELDENTMQALELIEQAERSKKISKKVAGDMRVELIKKVLESRVLSEEMQKQIRQIEGNK